MSRHFTVDDPEGIAIGAGILGAGEGGNQTHGKLRALREPEAGRRLQVIALDELPDRAQAEPLWGMGAPTVGPENPGRGVLRVDGWVRVAVPDLFTLVDRERDTRSPPRSCATACGFRSSGSRQQRR